MLPFLHFKRIVKRPHRHNRRTEIQPILEYLSQPILPYGSIARISKDTGIPTQTLSAWSHHRRDPTVKGEKESYTGDSCISAAGRKLPFWITAKEKTDLCHAKFKAPDDVIVRHTESGWTNQQIMLEDLPWLSQEAQGEPILLVLDAYPAHRTTKIQQRARELQIELLSVPAGATSEF
jgi:hypothetical protein